MECSIVSSERALCCLSHAQQSQLIDQLHGHGQLTRSVIIFMQVYSVATITPNCLHNPTFLMYIFINYISLSNCFVVMVVSLAHLYVNLWLEEKNIHEDTIQMIKASI